MRRASPALTRCLLYPSEILKNTRKGTYNVIKIDPAYRPAPIEDVYKRQILHITCPDSMISYSNGSRGLFVPSRVIGIFTATTISLSSRLRQRPDHYTIRAGRNLPDKEFRYLRTVIAVSYTHLYSAFAKYIIEQFLIQLSGNHTGNLFNLSLIHI